MIGRLETVGGGKNDWLQQEKGEEIEKKKGYCGSGGRSNVENREAKKDE